jgi:hypothetical protein
MNSWRCVWHESIQEASLRKNDPTITCGIALFLFLGLVVGIPVGINCVGQHRADQAPALWKHRMHSLLGRSRQIVAAKLAQQYRARYDLADDQWLADAGSTIIPPLDYVIGVRLDFDKRGRLVGYDVFEDASGL